MSYEGKERRENNYNIVSATAEAAKVVADAAAIAIRTVAQAAEVAKLAVSNDLQYIKQDISEIKAMLDSKYITKDQFAPVKMVTYGLVSVVLLSVVGGLMTVVLIK